MPLLLPLLLPPQPLPPPPPPLLAKSTTHMFLSFKYGQSSYTRDRRLTWTPPPRFTGPPGRRLPKC